MRRSLRTELVIELTILFAVAFVMPAMLWARLGPPVLGGRPISLGLVIGADVVLFATATFLLLGRGLVRPLRSLARAAGALSATERRPVGTSALLEIREIGTAIDSLAARVVDDEAYRYRVEKAASASRLSATVARGIGDSLGVMLANIHLLRKQLLGRAAPLRDLELVATLERESAALESLVRGLRDYARGRPVTATPVDLGEVIRTSAADLRARGVLQSVDVALELTAAPLYVLATRPDLEQLFTTLLVNAAEAMNGRGSVVVRLELAARFTLREPAARRSEAGTDAAVVHQPSSSAQRWLAGNDAAEIAKVIVADSGPGVPAALADRIFDPFFTTKAPGQGRGLGLAIAARTVENFRGTIWVTTAREGGAAFHLLFPAVPATIPRRSRTRRLTPATAHRSAIR